MYNKIYCLKCLDDNSIIRVKICKTKPRLEYERGYSANCNGCRVANTKIIDVCEEQLGEHDSITYISDESPVAKNLSAVRKGDKFRVTSDSGNVTEYLFLEETYGKGFASKEEAVDDKKQQVLNKKRQLIEKLQKFGFEGFIHTTELENFKGIIESGYLCSREHLITKDVAFADRACKGALDKTEEYIKRCCRFYYWYKTPTNVTAGYRNPIAIVFDEEILFFEKGVFFSPRNACCAEWTNNVDKALAFDWEGIFERGYYSLSKYCSGSISEENYKKINLVRNAEFLVKGNVSIKYIKKILVRDKETYEKIKEFCDEEIMLKVVISDKELNYD